MTNIVINLKPLWHADRKFKTRHTIGLGVRPFLFFFFNDPEATRKKKRNGRTPRPIVCLVLNLRSVCHSGIRLMTIFVKL